MSASGPQHSTFSQPLLGGRSRVHREILQHQLQFLTIALKMSLWFLPEQVITGAAQSLPLLFL